MHRTVMLGASVLASSLVCAGQSNAGGIAVEKLRCEYGTSQAIDETHPRLSWVLKSNERGQVQTAYQVLVSSSENALAADKADLWDSGKIASDQSIHVVYAGSPLKSRQRCYWKVRAWDKHGNASPWSKPAFWSMGLLKASDWNAKWIGLDEGETRGDEYRTLPARMLRREFNLERKIRRATVYMCGLGLSELYINGRKIGDHVLSPGLTDYTKRCLYVTFDVTKNLNPGANAVGAILGNGRYFAPRTNEPTVMVTYGYPKLLLQLEVEYDDGSTRIISSDDSWKLTTDGPIRANTEYDGEEYDATMQADGWSESGFDDSGWQNARLVDGPAGALRAQMAEPIRVMETIAPVAVTNPAPGAYVVDMGQNMVGWCRLKVSGPRGAKVTLRYAERLKDDGTIYTDNLRGARCMDVYTLKGGGTEVYEPRFTYHGFRYVEVTGYPGALPLSALEGRVVHDSVARAGEFSCSNPLLNKLYHNIYWGTRGNYRSMPTDCPQRDERQGWLGDRVEESKGEAYLFDIALLYGKWVTDMEDAQKENGSVPDVVPAYWLFYTDNVTWPSATVLMPGHLYDMYADARILKTHYASMKRWTDLMSGFLVDYIMYKDTYGDWCVPPESPELIHSKDPDRNTAGEFVASAWFYHVLRRMSSYATILGKTTDARQFDELAGKVKTAFNAKFLDKAAGKYVNGTQTSCVLPLAFGLAPEESKPKVFQRLIDNIMVDHRGHLGTGLVGGQWLMRVLSDNGRPDVAYALAVATSYPSWGYMLDHGATTIWELWNGDKADPAMNSGNHVMLIGDLCTWMHEYLGGVAPYRSMPGFKHIVMRPRPVGDLTSAHVRYESLYGSIVSDWKITGGKFVWKITVPANTTATICVPAAGPDAVTEGGNPAGSSEAVKLVGTESGGVVYEIGSGDYSFTAVLRGAR